MGEELKVRAGDGDIQVWVQWPASRLVLLYLAARVGQPALLSSPPYLIWLLWVHLQYIWPDCTAVSDLAVKSTTTVSDLAAIINTTLAGKNSSLGSKFTWTWPLKPRVPSWSIRPWSLHCKIHTYKQSDYITNWGDNWVQSMDSRFFFFWGGQLLFIEKNI